MIPATFDYKVAESAEQAISLLGEFGDEANLLAGGHSLIPMMKFRLATPTQLIDVGRQSLDNRVGDTFLRARRGARFLTVNFHKLFHALEALGAGIFHEFLQARRPYHSATLTGLG